MVAAAERLRRGVRGSTLKGSKGAKGVPRERIEIDTSKYSGRVAARIRKLIDEKQVPIKDIVDAILKSGETVSERTLFAYLNNTRTLHPDLYPVVAKALKVPLSELLPPK